MPRSIAVSYFQWKAIGRRGVRLAVVPGNCELELKALVKATGDKKIDTVPLKEVEPLTGYIRGGVTALACKKEWLMSGKWWQGGLQARPG